MKHARRIAPILLLAALAACDQQRDTLPTNPTAAPPSAELAPLLSAGAGAVPGRYVVVLDGSVQTASAGALQTAVASGGTVHYTYETVLNGFAATLTPEAVEELRRNPQVQYVAQDGMAYPTQATQTGPPWGLDRIDQRALPLSNTYTYAAMGAGVRVYVIDSGIRTSHSEFGGRASVGTDFVGDGQNGQDCRGHGTHVAGTIAGSTYGVAKGARVVSVRVFGCTGGAEYSTVIAAVEWVTTHAQKPAVVNMSLGGSVYTPVNQAVQASIASGLTYVVSAGNDNADACGQSPASTPQAITVGATGQTDLRASFSNWGTCLDLFAPGVEIASAWYTSNSAAALLSGTSMAAPHAAGVAALYLQAQPTATPAAVALRLATTATGSVVQSPGSGSPNKLLFSPVSVIPVPPLNTAAAILTPGSIRVTWTDASDNEASFQVERRIYTGGAWGAWQLVHTTPANGTSVDDTGLTAGNTYHYRVRACNAAGCSAWVPAPALYLSNAPVAPMSVTVTPRSGSEARVSWVDASTNERRFEIDRRHWTGGAWGEWVMVSTRDRNSTRWDAGGLVGGQQYQFRVRACNASGCSANATSATVVMPTRPAMPLNLVGTALSETVINLTWTDASSDETRFEVFRAVRIGGTWTSYEKRATLPANTTSYSNTGLNDDTRYRYLVRACNVAGCSAWAASGTVTTP